LRHGPGGCPAGGDLHRLPRVAPRPGGGTAARRPGAARGHPRRLGVDDLAGLGRGAHRRGVAGDAVHRRVPAVLPHADHRRPRRHGPARRAYRRRPRPPRPPPHAVGPEGRMNQISLTWAFLTDADRWPLILSRTLDHLGYTALAVGLSLLIALPLGLWVGHSRRG